MPIVTVDVDGYKWVTIDTKSCCKKVASLPPWVHVRGLQKGTHSVLLWQNQGQRGSSEQQLRVSQLCHGSIWPCDSYAIHLCSYTHSNHSKLYTIYLTPANVMATNHWSQQPKIQPPKKQSSFTLVYMARPHYSYMYYKYGAQMQARSG